MTKTSAPGRKARNAALRLVDGSRRKDGLYTTGDMARLSNSTLRTVRFYEEAGILAPVQRTEGGHRLFERSELDKLRLVTDLRAAGFALDEIRSMLEAKGRAKDGGSAAQDVVQRLESQIGEMTQRLHLLQRLVAELESTKAHLQRCASCVDSKRFPNECQSCANMADAANAPAAVGVLWNVESAR